MLSEMEKALAGNLMALQVYAVKYGGPDECRAAFCLYTISRCVEDCWRRMASLSRVTVQKWILGTNRVLRRFNAKPPAIHAIMGPVSCTNKSLLE